MPHNQSQPANQNQQVHQNQPASSAVFAAASAVNLEKKFYGPHHPLLLNADVIVFETLLTKGQVLPMHDHPKPHLRYTFSPGVQEHTWKNGSISVQTDKVGAFEWRDSLEHQVRNVGEADIHSLVFEFNRPDEDAADLFEQGSALWQEQDFTSASVALDNHRLKVLEVSLDGKSQTQNAELKHAPTLIYTQTPWKARVHFGKGFFVEGSFPAGQALWFTAGLRGLANSGVEPARLMVLALKKC